MKGWAILTIIFLLWVALPAEEQISRMGQHPFLKAKIDTPERFQAVTEKKADEIKAGFEKAGQSDLFPLFMEKIKNREFEQTSLASGERFQWMLFRKNKQVDLKSDLVWTGKKSISAYTMNFFSNGTLYYFAVPIDCFNISLLRSEEVPAPICSLRVSPLEVEPGKPITIDVCDSANATKNVVSILDANGTPVKKVEFPPDCRQEVVLDDPGTYTVVNEAEGRFGLKSKNPCRVEVKVAVPPAPLPPPPPMEMKKRKGAKAGAAGTLHLLADLGFSQMKDPSNFLFVRAGIYFPITDNFRINLLTGPFINISGNSYGTPFTLDATVSYYFSKFFLGGGIGGWLVKNDSKLDLIFDAGYEIFTTEKTTGALFIEYRAGTSDFDQLDDFGRYGLGFRLCF